MKIYYKIIRYLAMHGYLNWMEDEAYLKLLYKARMGKKLNLYSPTTYNEKIQWLKLYDRKPEYTIMVDKFEAKKYVASIIGDEYIIPTLGVWNKFGEIEFDKLPQQFVLKCTHDSGGIVICKDKKHFDKNKARRIINKSLKNQYYFHGREWPYKNVKPRIIAEKYIVDSQMNELRDYKFFTFNGKAKALFIATERQKKDETKFDFYDMEFKHLSLINGHPNAAIAPEKPMNFEKMRQLAERLSKGIPHLRVDLYEVDEKVYFGELTFSHWSGMTPFEPEEWDEIFGNWICLPQKGFQGEGTMGNAH